MSAMPVIALTCGSEIRRHPRGGLSPRVRRAAPPPPRHAGRPRDTPAGNADTPAGNDGAPAVGTPTGTRVGTPARRAEQPNSQALRIIRPRQLASSRLVVYRNHNI